MSKSSRLFILIKVDLVLDTLSIWLFVIIFLLLDSLKADLIEYEEKYEKCKADNTKTSKQLTYLTEQFDKLKFRLDAAEKATDNSEEKLIVGLAVNFCLYKGLRLT